MSLNLSRLNWKTTLFYGLAAWIAAALVGYGIALQKYGEKLTLTQIIPTIQASKAPTAAIEGRITAAQIKWPKSRGATFRVEGLDQELQIAEDFVGSDQVWQMLDRTLRVGTKVKVYYQVESLWVMELQVNPGTVFQKTVISGANASMQFKESSKKIAHQGRVLIWIGALLLPLLIALKYGISLKTKAVTKTAG